MTTILHQKGANGLVAEYVAALATHRALAAAGVSVGADEARLLVESEEAVARVAGELSAAQLDRATSQGQALGEYIASSLLHEPGRVGLDLEPTTIGRSLVTVTTVGRHTNSRTSADLLLTIEGSDGAVTHLPISLKAYRSSVSSLGSKSARASLSRLFLDKEKVTDAEFVAFFGEPGRRFLEALLDFKVSAKEFYASPTGELFVDAYEARKGSRKVNNPLRRKEVGDHYAATRGQKSEHLFADLYVQMWQVGVDRLREAGPAQWTAFLTALRFVLGMDEDILTLNAVAGSDGRVLHVNNSFEDDAYADVRKVLVPHCEVRLTHRPMSSGIGVRISHAGLVVSCLTLAIWKDATIQFKLDSRIVS